MAHNTVCYKLAAALKKCRRDQGLTQAQLAAAIGVCQVTVARWETGKAWPRATQLQRLFDIFAINLAIKE